MRYTMTGESLAKALKTAALAIEARNSIPLLGMVHMKAGGGQLTLTATNLDSEVRVIAEDCPGEWEAAIPAKPLASMLKGVKGEVRIVGERGEAKTVKVHGVPDREESDSAITLEAGRSKMRLAGGDPNDFPHMKAEGIMARLDMSAADLAAALAFTKASESKEETRYYLVGTHFDSRSVVSTDGHRLHKIERHGANLPGAYIVPSAATAILRAVLKGGEGALSFNPAKFRLEAGPVTVTGKLIDASFPDYTRVIPQTDGMVAFRIDADALACAVKRVSAISQERSKSVRFAFADETLTLTCRTTDGATMSEELECEGVGSREVGFNASYVLDVLAALGGDVVTLYLSGKDQGGVLDPTRWERDGYSDRLCVLMPLRA